MIAYFNSAIDTIKGAQSQVLSTVVTNEAYRKPLQSLVDASADFTKTAAKASYDFYDQLTKFDVSDFMKVGKDSVKK